MTDKATPRAMTEKQLQKAVLQLAGILGWRTYHTYDSRRSQPGFPDLVMLKARRTLYVELKTERGRVRPEQRAWLDELAAAGNEVYLWRPVDWSAGIVEAVLRGIPQEQAA